MAAGGFPTHSRMERMKRLILALSLLFILGCTADTMVGPQENETSLEPAITIMKCNPNIQPC
jgi:hypothetical protein